MEENFNNNQQPQKQEPGLKTKKNKAKVAVITLSTIVVLFIGLQVYASTNGYGNVFFMIKDWTTSKNASGEKEVFKDSEIVTSDESNEIKENTSKTTNTNNNNDTDADFFAKNANIQYKEDLTNPENGKAAIIKSGEEILKTTQNNGYYTYTDMWNNSYNIKKIKDVKSEFTQLGKDKQSALYKCTIYYIDNNNQDKSFDVAVILAKDAEGGIIGTYDNYTGSTRYTRWSGLYDEENTENTQLEPDNYSKMVEIDDAYDKFLEKMTKTKSTRIDIDNDGVHELIVAKGDFEAEKEISFYTYKNGKVTDLGTLGFGHSTLYKMNNKDYLLQVYGQMGGEEVSKVYIKNGKIQKEKISERQIDPDEGYTKGDILLQELVY